MAVVFHKYHVTNIMKQLVDSHSGSPISPCKDEKAQWFLHIGKEPK